MLCQLTADAGALLTITCKEKSVTVISSADKGTVELKPPVVSSAGGNAAVIITPTPPTKRLFVILALLAPLVISSTLRKTRIKIKKHARSSSGFY